MDILVTLRQQHKNLESYLTVIKNQATQDPPNSNEIVKNLGEFKKILLEHLDLEDNTFYPQLLIKMSAIGKDVAGIKEFIAKMFDIAEKVTIFLDTYDNGEKINDKLNNFRVDFDNVISILSTRIKAEEVFIFTDWELLQAIS